MTKASIVYKKGIEAGQSGSQSGEPTRHPPSSTQFNQSDLSNQAVPPAQLPSKARFDALPPNSTNQVSQSTKGDAAARFNKDKLKKPPAAPVKTCDDDSDKEEGELSSDQEKPLPKTNLEKPVRNY